ncbi:hypothetical protein H7U20_25130, partial [Rugamonas sp. CCM 8940]
EAPAAPAHAGGAGAAGPARQPLQQRLYPNLRPVGLDPNAREQAFSLHEWYGSYGMRGSGGRGLYVPNARYVFVRTQGGETLMHPRLRHPALARGEPVRYAGEAYFESGALRWWSNASGHYRPDPQHAPQAGLPMALFRSWDDVVRRGTRPAGPAPGK